MGHIPKPFKRPAIDLGSVKRMWKLIEANEIEVGDTVPDVGLVTQVKFVGNTIALTNVQGVTHTLRSHEYRHVFTTK